MIKLLRGAAPLLLLVTLFAASATPAKAQSEARMVLEGTVDKVLVTLQDPGLKDHDKRDGVLKQVEQIISSLFDFEELSARTVGAAWRTFSADQKSRFTDAFTTLLRETYIGKFDGYNGEKVEYLDEISSSDGSKVELQTIVLMNDKKVPVSYRMLQKQKWVVYDVIIEGVGMVQNYRKQFQEILVKGDAEQLISLVQKKADETKAHNRQQQLSQ